VITMRRIILPLAAALALAGSVLAGPAAQAAPSLRSAPPAPPAATPPRADLRAALGTIVAAGAPGAIGLVRHGDHTERAAAGAAQAGTGIPMLPGDHVRIGSVTKTFTAVVVLQLVAGHRLRLQDTVNRWLPGALPYGGNVTVGELLNHTSGIPEYMTKVTELYATQSGSWLWHWPPAQLLALVSAEPPLFPPGTRWSYSNTDYILLGMIIQRVTGHSPAEEIEQRILRPLRLQDTSFPADAVTLPAPGAHGYLPGTGTVPVDVTTWNPSAAGAAGAIISTASDLSRFYRALLTGDLLPPAQLTQMLTTVDIGGGAGYGLGVIELPTPCGPAIGHNGAVFGYITDVFTTPGGDRQVILASTLDSPAALQAQESQIAGLLCG
jgi:D-alanyl-D-alanine carboxypeptidase